MGAKTENQNQNTLMKAHALAGDFGLENLIRCERPIPQPGSGQVLVKIRAVSLNYRDLLMIRGAYNPRQPLPLIPCSDAVGHVVAVGSGVTRVSEGDRVIPIFAQRWIAGEPTREKLASTLGGPLDGTLAEYIVVDEEGLVHAPASLSDVAASTLPCAGLTAWSALVTQGGVKAGDTVVVLGTGGVSMFALQMAKLLGARVIVTSSQDEKLERAQALGADHGINYRQTPSWSKAVGALTDGRGADCIVEVGGAGTLEESLRAVRVGGLISLIGVLAGVRQPLLVTRILMQCVRIQGIMVGHREGFVAMNRAIEAHRLEPVVDRVFEVDAVHQAFEHMAAGRHVGKIVVQIS